MTIDWTKAPKAKYHAFDADSRGIFCRTQPWPEDDHWQAIDSVYYSGYILPAGQDWRQSLVERPKEETK